MTTDQIDARIKTKQEFRSNLMQRREQALEQLQQLQQLVAQIEREVFACNGALIELGELRAEQEKAAPEPATPPTP